MVSRTGVNAIRVKSILSDQKIELSSAINVPTFRLGKFIDFESGTIYSFLSNNYKLSAVTIAAIYKGRWQVELFFKAIKQNLKIKALSGLSRNAVLTQIWIAMTTFLLVSFARYSAKQGWTVQRILRGLQTNLFECKTLRQRLQPDPSWNKKASLNEVRCMIANYETAVPCEAFLYLSIFI